MRIWPSLIPHAQAAKLIQPGERVFHNPAPAEAATCIQRIQRARTQMNLQLANVISDISGLTGKRIIRAIVAGERDPRKPG